MTTPSSLPQHPQAPAAPVPDEAVVETAKKLVRVRSVVKTTFTRFAPPVATGVLSAVLIDRARRRSQEQEETDTVDTTPDA